MLLSTTLSLTLVVQSASPWLVRFGPVSTPGVQESAVSKSPVKPELVFAVVGATGTDLDGVCASLSGALSTMSYECSIVRLSAILHEFPKWSSLPGAPEEERISSYMDAGDEVREQTARGDALAILACGAVRQLRQEIVGSPTKPAPNRAYVLRSLKHPQEVAALRRIYGSNFHVIGAYSRRPNRVANLAARIAQTHNSSAVDAFRGKAEELILRDQEESGRKLGQQLRETFPLSDIFVDADDRLGMDRAINRFVEILFGHPFHTPTKDEYGMFHAQAAGLRSAALGRQVGATIATETGDVIAVGTNEVPKAGGGLYWSDDSVDHRDFTLKYDSMDRFKRQMLAEIIDRFQRAGWLSSSRTIEKVDKLVDEAQAGPIRGAQLLNVLEYGRIVHAEMAAITEAARRGVGVEGATLFTTTYPCHNCARHIVAAGIRRVVYVEPYPKSLTALLHMDAVTDDGTTPKDTQIAFESFVGIAPRRYMDLFEMVQRKHKDGSTVEFIPTAAMPREASVEPTYLAREAVEVEEIGKLLRGNDLFGFGDGDDDEAGMANEAV
jgi:deoxycytidylate deaminase